MAITLAAAGSMLLSVWLFHASRHFTIDAAPVGSMMIAAAALLFVGSFFLFGVSVGKYL